MPAYLTLRNILIIILFLMLNFDLILWHIVPVSVYYSNFKKIGQVKNKSTNVVAFKWLMS